MTTTLEVQRALPGSGIPAPARLIVHALAVRADFKTGVIPEQHTPSLTDLVNDTGLSRSSVKKWLNGLEAGGWVERDRPDVVAARTEYARTGYRLTVGGPIPEPADDADPRPPDDLGRHRAQTPRPPRDPDLGRGTAQPRPPDGHVIRKTPTGSTDPLNNRASHTHNQRAREPEPDRFDEFWTAYPRKVDKGHARKTWAKAIKAGADPDTVIAAAHRYAADPGRRASEPRFTPHPATWLNGERWLDVPDTGQARASPGTDLREYQGARLKPSTIALIEDNARFQAMDAAAARHAIEGTAP